MALTDIDLISLFLPSNGHNRELVWLLVKFIYYVWSTVRERETEVKVDKLYGFLKWKYKNERDLLGISELDRCLR